MQNLSLKKLLLNDSLARLLASGSLLFLLLTAFADGFAFLPRQESSTGFSIDAAGIIEWSYLSLMLAALSALLLALRIRQIGKILSSGPRITATLLDVRFFKERARIDYEYTIYRMQNRSSLKIARNAQTESLAAGDEIELALDPFDCTKSYFVDLYCEDSPEESTAAESQGA